MSISLVKGQKISLRKNSGDALTKVCVGLGWDPVKPQAGGKGFFNKILHAIITEKPQDIDVDASCFLLQNDHIVHTDDIVYFGHLMHSTHAVHHMGDNLTGEGDGDDEQILVNLKDLPPEYNRLVFVVNIYHADTRHQDFGQIENCFIRIVDSRTGKEFCRFNLSDRTVYANKTAMIFGSIYRHDGEWKFAADGTATDDCSIAELANRYR